MAAATCPYSAGIILIATVSKVNVGGPKLNRVAPSAGRTVHLSVALSWSSDQSSTKQVEANGFGQSLRLQIEDPGSRGFNSRRFPEHCHRNLDRLYWDPFDPGRY